MFFFFFVLVSCQSWTGSSDVDMILGTVRDITIIPINTRDLKISLQAVVTKKKEAKCFSFFYYQIKIYWQWYFYFYFVV